VRNIGYDIKVYLTTQWKGTICYNNSMKYCHKCHTPWEGFGQPGTRATCAKCGADLHSCRNCRLYDTGKPYQCQVDTDPVRDKERYNYCEEFQFAEKRPQDTAGKNEADGARGRWDQLFKKK
jgi:hypothetical protein